MKKPLIILFVTTIACLFLSSCATSNFSARVEIAKMKMDSAYTEGDTKDTWNLRDEAAFEVAVSNGVWWVPANVLGHSRYTNKQIAAIGGETPKIKKALIGNLYEAIQLYQIGDFSTDAGSGAEKMNVWVKDTTSSLKWEKHCPGYYAVLANRGNCSTDTNWIIYLIGDDYDEWGTMHFQDKDGSGHVWNWFFYEGFYYFIDMTHYRNDFKKSAVESGELWDYHKSDIVLGNIHKALSPEVYAQYLIRTSTSKPSLIYMTKGIEVPDLGGDKNQNPTHMNFDSRIRNNITVVYHDKKNITYGFYINHTEVPNWSEKKQHPFRGKTTF